MGQVEKLASAWQYSKVGNKQEVLEEAQKESKTVHVAALMELCHLNKSELKKSRSTVVMQ